MDLAGFYAARLDEDEAAAKEAAEDSGPEWSRGPNGLSGMVVAASEIVVYDEGRPTEAEADHIARHDPARVLREVEADRKLLAMWEDPAWVEDPRKHPDSEWKPGDFWQDGRDQGEIELQVAVAQTIDDMVRIRAAVHSGHPGYQQEWKP